MLNQPPPLEGYNVYGADVALHEAVTREHAAWAHDELHALGAQAGEPETIQWGFAANRYPPELHTHDRYGNRIDEVEYHPAYHHLMHTAVANGLHARPWRDDRDGAHVARAAKFMVWSQVDAGHGCPISMTYSIVPALRANAALSAEWEPVLTADEYDPRLVPLADKRGAIAGMAMTEKQGGSDVRANTTRALDNADGTWLITGHKWFCSAPMSDAFLMLAQAPGGLSCFFVPRVLADGTRNPVLIQRLKDKLGNRSNASSEVEFDATLGWLVGEEGRGVATILEMVNHTRLDCVIGASSTLRQAVVQAIHHSRHRRAFGSELIDQPLMRNVLADLALESEASTMLAMRLARAYDLRSDDFEMQFRRIGTAVSKYYVNKRLPAAVGEALECLGGAGYVEDSIMPRLFRESPLNGIWEGSGNVICLDVLRAIEREPKALDAFFAVCEVALTRNRHFDKAFDSLRRDLADLEEIESRARRIVEEMAVLLQASLMLRHAPEAAADAFCTSRLGRNRWAFGTLPSGLATQAIIDRAFMS